MEVDVVRRPADVLLNYYNSICRSKVKPYEKNLKLIEECLKLNDQNEEDLEDHMRWYCLYKNDQNLKPDFEECMQQYGDFYKLAYNAKELIEDEAPQEQEKEEKNDLRVDSSTIVLEEEVEMIPENDKKTGTQILEKVKNTIKNVSKQGQHKEKKVITHDEDPVDSSNNGAVPDEVVREVEEMQSNTEQTQQAVPEGLSDSFGLLGASMAGMIQNIITETLSNQYSNMLNDAKREAFAGQASADLLFIKTKNSNSPLDLRRISFPLCHTAFTRVICFDWYSKFPQGIYRDGYGTTLLGTLGRAASESLIKKIFGPSSVYITYAELKFGGEEYLKSVLGIDKVA